MEEPVYGVHVGQDMPLWEAPQEAWEANVRGDTVWNFQGEAEREGDWLVDWSPKGRGYISQLMVLGACRLWTDAFQAPQEVQMSHLLGFQELMA